MFSKFLVHAQRWCGHVNNEHSILVYWWSNSFWHAKRCLNNLGLQCTKIGCSLYRFKHCLQVCTTSGKRLLIMHAKTATAKSQGTNSWRKSYWVKDQLQCWHLEKKWHNDMYCVICRCIQLQGVCCAGLSSPLIQGVLYVCGHWCHIQKRRHYWRGRYPSCRHYL
jgi:hypothetical protein